MTDHQNSPPNEEVEAKTNRKIRFYYEKSPAFRTIHADGLLGGVTGKGMLQLAVFSERIAIPKEVVHAISASGEVESELERIGKDGILRELEVNVAMTLPVARRVRDWFMRQVEILETLESLQTKPSDE